jgi:hypothetical protein
MRRRVRHGLHVGGDVSHRNVHVGPLLQRGLRGLPHGPRLLHQRRDLHRRDEHDGGDLLGIAADGGREGSADARDRVFGSRRATVPRTLA